ncbi:hypothetical protein AGLY_010701 [Aphis glycines]|uniref:Uncharacterized protein n=1 Tax=Aphis glycines TaxID=307491 RepID=A0A6G0TEG9_APHGL|nr:hypothetical protein AGLY_010701 [Aphis glycines]
MANENIQVLNTAMNDTGSVTVIEDLSSSIALELALLTISVLRLVISCGFADIILILQSSSLLSLKSIVLTGDIVLLGCCLLSISITGGLALSGTVESSGSVISTSSVSDKDSSLISTISTRLSSMRTLLLFKDSHSSCLRFVGPLGPENPALSVNHLFIFRNELKKPITQISASLVISKIKYDK